MGRRQELRSVSVDERTDRRTSAIGRLSESEASLVVDFKDLLDGVDVRRCP